MRWFLNLGIMAVAIILGGCGAGQGSSNSAPVGSLTPLIAASGSPTPDPSPIPPPPSVLVTMVTDYTFADQAIRFIQYDGDEDFLPVITRVNQGFRFQFALPKGYRYQLWFADIPSIDVPAPYEVDLINSEIDILELPMFHFPIHP